MTKEIQSEALLCATSPVNPEFTLCGDAFDAYESGDSERPIIFAKQGERVNCEQCLIVIIEIRNTYTNNGLMRKGKGI